MITPLMPDLFSRRSGICTFREATSHTGPEFAPRVHSSADLEVMGRSLVLVPPGLSELRPEPIELGLQVSDLGSQ